MLSRLRDKLFPVNETIAPPSGGFVDIHAHVIPGVDDGPKAWDQSIQQLKNAAAAGTSLLVATLHGDGRAKWTTVDELRHAVKTLNLRCQDDGLKIRVVLGMENPLERPPLARLDAGTALCLDGAKHLLVEFPYVAMPLGWEEILFQIQLSGRVPIIVHPERQTEVQKDPMLLAGPVERGVLVQVTAGSLAATFGSHVRHTAETLMRKGLVHILASDTHWPEGSRSPSMMEGYTAAARLVGVEAAGRMAASLPRSLLSA